MLQFLESAQIDRAAWDACVQAAGRTAYGFSWYLDTVCEHWGGLVLGAYDAVFPLPWKSRAGLSWLYAPFFCQQLGVYARPIGHSEQAATLPPTGEWLHAIPRRFRKADLSVAGPASQPISSHNLFPSLDTQPASFHDLPTGWRSTERPNYILDLSLDADALRTNYESNTRRNLKKAHAAGLQTDHALNSGQLLALIRLHQGPKLPLLGEREYRRILDLMNQAQERGRAVLIRSFDPSQPAETLAGAFFLLAPRGPLYLFGTTTPAARQNGAMTQVFDRLIGDFSGKKGRFLDFEGSALPGLARFYQGFGAVQEPYYTLHMRRFPLLFKGLGA